jgi:hypothetical protein
MAVQQYVLRDFELESGGVLPEAILAYATRRLLGATER